jgi:hypothetical protein
MGFDVDDWSVIGAAVDQLRTLAVAQVLVRLALSRKEVVSPVLVESLPRKRDFRLSGRFRSLIC